MTLRPSRHGSVSNLFMRGSDLKSSSRYTLIFATDDATTDALITSASRSIASDTCRERICDRYHEPSQEVFRAKSKFARRQYRVRRIDNAVDARLESLSWKRDLCSRRQTVVPSSELTHLQSDRVDPSWSGKWFHKKLIKHDLVPSLEFRFDRTIWKRDSIDGQICLTVDSNIQASFSSPAALSANLVRMNFSVCLPALFKALIYEFVLLPEQPTVLLELSRAAAPVVVDEAKIPVERLRLQGLVVSSLAEYA